MNSRWVDLINKSAITMTRQLENLTVPTLSRRSDTQRVAFSKKSLDGLTHSATGKSPWEWHYDIRQPGLAIGIGRTGIKTFYLVRKFCGKSRRFLIGKYPTVDIDVARKVAQVLNSQLAQGIDPALTKNESMTFSELFDKFMDEYSRLRNRTAERNVVTFKRYLATVRYGKPLSQMHISAIKKEHIRKLFAEITKHAPVHANRVLALIRSVFNRAIAWDIWTGDNPCKGVMRNPEQARERWLDNIELPYLFRALDHETNETLRDFVYVALFTGARRGNVLPMRWEDIDFDAQVWQIGMTKNGTPQTIPLVQPLYELLKERRKSVDSPWVFPANSMAGHYVEPKKGWATILERATAFRLIDKLAEYHGWSDSEKQRAIGIADTKPANAVAMYTALCAEIKVDLKPLDMRDLRVHDLRRTLGSWQAGLNVSLAIIGRTLNHKSPQSTKVYARLALDPVRDAMATATSAMLKHRAIVMETAAVL